MDKGKRNKYNIQIPLPIENHLNECNEIKSQNIDIEKTSINLHEKMKTVLKPLEWIVYKGLFIDHLEEKAVAAKLGYKSNEKDRLPGYGRLNQFKKSIMIQVKKVLQEGDVEIVGDNDL